MAVVNSMGQRGLSSWSSQWESGKLEQIFEMAVRRVLGGGEFWEIGEVFAGAGVDGASTCL